jgi:hypothetical protein
MYNVHVPYHFLWSIDGSFERRRWPPRAQAATPIENADSYQFEPNSFEDDRPALKLRWVVVIHAKGSFSLQPQWNPAA